MTAEHRSRDIEQPKLLSVIITGRNDDYMGNFKYRLGTCINYLARNLEKLGRLDDVEILVTDWNSDAPLSEVLPLTPEAAQICRFVWVPPKVALENQLPDQVFNTTCAVNVSLRRAQGEFSMLTGADVLFPTFSVRTLLELLDGEIPIPFELDSCLFLCSREHIPWDMLPREPSLREWDQYLLLAGGELQDTGWRFPGRWPGMGVGCSALMMHSSLWHACHGLDERLTGWGWSDADLALRITQSYPWMQLKSVGVMTFEMDHYPQASRELECRKQNPQEVSLSFAVNDENWGLGDYELEVQTAGNATRLPRVHKPLERTDAITAWDQTCDDLIAELTGQQVRELLLSTLENPWSIDPTEWASLRVLAWYSLHHLPRRYLEWGIGSDRAASVVGGACPSVEIYGVDSCQAPGRDGAVLLSDTAYRLHGVGHRGYVRFVTGDTRTALQRLRDSFPGFLSLDLMLFRGDIFGGDVAQQLNDFVPHLAPGGAIVLTCASADTFEQAWNQMQRKFRQFTYLRCEGTETGLIMAVSLRNDELSTRSDVANELRVNLGGPPAPPPPPPPPPPPLTPGRQFVRVGYALRNPLRYPEYATRLYRLSREWIRSRKKES